MTVYSISGCVNKPGNYELPLGVTMRELIYNYAGGIRGGNKFKAVFPRRQLGAPAVRRRA